MTPHIAPRSLGFSPRALCDENIRVIPAADGGWENGPMKVKLTVSEARAEAAALLLSRLLDSIPAREAARIREAAMKDARETGVEAVIEEMTWILIPQL